MFDDTIDMGALGPYANTEIIVAEEIREVKPQMKSTIRDIEGNERGPSSFANSELSGGDPWLSLSQIQGIVSNKGANSGRDFLEKPTIPIGPKPNCPPGQRAEDYLGPDGRPMWGCMPGVDLTNEPTQQSPTGQNLTCNPPYIFDHQSGKCVLPKGGLSQEPKDHTPGASCPPGFIWDSSQLRCVESGGFSREIQSHSRDDKEDFQTHGKTSGGTSSSKDRNTVPDKTEKNCVQNQTCDSGEKWSATDCECKPVASGKSNSFEDLIVPALIGFVLFEALK
tara:strand:- start:749 stop:1588 length:840 start_codon:yes stop_codon:yes gene_type:complete